MLGIKVLLVLFLGLSALGCTGKSSVSSQVVEVEDWSPEKVEIQCSSGDCPDGVGGLFLVQRHQPRSLLVRCTASLIGPNQILTNAHCLGLITYFDEAYFILRHQGRMIHKPVAGIDEVLEAPAKKLGRDLAVLRLAEDLPAIQPRGVAREIAPDLSQVTAFVINSALDPKHRLKFVLDKKTCRTESHVGILKLGLADRGVAAALFDCTISPGNSGSPVFHPADFNNIQMLVTSVYTQNEFKKFFGEKDPFIGVYWETPNFQRQDFGAAERVHCLNVPGFTEPKVRCSEVVDQILSFDLASQAHKISERWIANHGFFAGYRWHAEALRLEKPPDQPHRAIQLIPKVFCRSPGVSVKPKTVELIQEVQIVALDTNGDLRAVTDQQKALLMEIPANVPLCDSSAAQKVKALTEKMITEAL